MARLAGGGGRVRAHLCQRVNADHLPPAGLLPPPADPHVTGRANRPFGRARVAGSDLRTATAETAARNLVASVSRDLWLPDSDVVASDRDSRFTSALWTGLHAALGAWLIFASPHPTTAVARRRCWHAAADAACRIRCDDPAPKGAQPLIQPAWRARCWWAGLCSTYGQRGTVARLCTLARGGARSSDGCCGAAA